MICSSVNRLFISSSKAILPEDLHVRWTRFWGHVIVTVQSAGRRMVAERPGSDGCRGQRAASEIVIGHVRQIRGGIRVARVRRRRHLAHPLEKAPSYSYRISVPSGYVTRVWRSRSSYSKSSSMVFETSRLPGGSCVQSGRCRRTRRSGDSWGPRRRGAAGGLPSRSLRRPRGGAIDVGDAIEPVVREVRLRSGRWPEPGRTGGSWGELL